MLPAENNQKILGAIIAGGNARRMNGSAKHLLKIDDQTILEHIAKRLRPQVDALVLNVNDDVENSLYYDFKVVSDVTPEPYGPLGGLYSVLNYACTQGYERVITTSGDTPFLPGDFVVKMRAIEKCPIVVAKSNGRVHPVIALWDVSLLHPLKGFLDRGERQMRKWIFDQKHVEVSWDGEPDPFFNINTPSDLEKATLMFKSQL